MHARRCNVSPGKGSLMKITDVRTAVIEGNFDWVLVRVYTDEGVTGLGEAYWGAGVNELVHKIRPLLIGEDPTNVGKLYEKMVRRCPAPVRWPARR